MRLPASAQEIADVIGRERALYLIGQLPRSYQTRKASKQTSWHVILYVPKVLKPDHPLVRVLGWQDAKLLVDAFGGEILNPAGCQEVYRAFRDQAIIRMSQEGMKPKEVAELMGCSDRHVRNLVREKAQEELKASNDNNRPSSSTKPMQAAS